jgi:hypothetical protein
VDFDSESGSYMGKGAPSSVAPCVCRRNCWGAANPSNATVTSDDVCDAEMATIAALNREWFAAESVVPVGSATPGVRRSFLAAERGRAAPAPAAHPRGPDHSDRKRIYFLPTRYITNALPALKPGFGAIPFRSGPEAGTPSGAPRSDCLHFCPGSGVDEAVALMLLSLLSGIRGGTLPEPPAMDVKAFRERRRRGCLACVERGGAAPAAA